MKSPGGGRQGGLVGGIPGGAGVRAESCDCAVRLPKQGTEDWSLDLAISEANICDILARRRGRPAAGHVDWLEVVVQR